MDPSVALLVATALHAGFQLTVTLVVYPAFGRVPADAWSAFHDGHSRGIAPLVALLYAVLLLAAGWRSVVGPLDLGLAVALLGLAVSLGTTALVAAPTHGKLGHQRGAGPDPALLTRLRRADAVRTLGALLALGGALVTAA